MPTDMEFHFALGLVAPIDLRSLATRCGVGGTVDRAMKMSQLMMFSVGGDC